MQKSTSSFLLCLSPYLLLPSIAFIEVEVTEDEEPTLCYVKKQARKKERSIGERVGGDQEEEKEKGLLALRSPLSSPN